MARTSRSRYTVVAMGVVPAALLAGCSVLEGSTAGSARPAGSSAVRHPAPRTSESPGPGASPQATNASAGGALSRCHTADLSARLDDPPRQRPTDHQGELGAAGIHLAIDLVWTNHSTRSCTMRGFPGVDLRGPAPDTGEAVSYSLPRAGTPRTVTLAPGRTARSVIRYIDPRKDQAKAAQNPGAYWWPERLVVTPPGETTSLTVDWTAGSPVDYKDRASGTAAASISPVRTRS